LRFKLQALVGLLLLSTFALALHVESARYEQPLAFAGGHILHGDLRPNTGDAPANILALAISTTPAILLSMLVLARLPLLASRADDFSDRRTRQSLMRYLARLFRAPPRLLPLVS